LILGKTKRCYIIGRINIVSFGVNAALVDTLVAKTHAWEETHDTSFTYDGIPILAMLDEYDMLRHEREEEKRRKSVRSPKFFVASVKSFQGYES
jgi:hypothetical protein